MLLNSAKKSVFIWIDLFFIFTALLLGFLNWKNIISAIPFNFGLEYDYSFGNIYNLSKWFFISITFIILWTRSRQPLYVALSVVFAGVFFDDAFQVHEKVNSAISLLLSVPSHYVGVFLLLGLTFFSGILILASWKSSSVESRLYARNIAFLVVVLILVGGGLDTLQSEVYDISPRKFAWHLTYGIGVIEDGLELLIASMILIYSKLVLDGTADEKENSGINLGK